MCNLFKFINRLAIGLTFLAIFQLAFISSVHAQVFLIDTKARPSTETFFVSFNSVCDTCGKISYINGEGSPKLLRAAVRRISAQSDAVIVAFGSPAANAVLRASPEAKLITAIASNIDLPPSASRHDLPTEINIEWALKLSQKIVGDSVRIALVGGPEAIARAQSAAHNCSNSCLFLEVSSPSKLPEILSRAYVESDFVVLLKDATIINRQSIDYIVKTAIASEKYTLAFSHSLSAMGIPFVVSPDFSAQGRRAAEFVMAARANAPTPDITAFSDFTLHVNCAALRRIGPIRTETIPDICDVDQIEIEFIGSISVDAR